MNRFLANKSKTINWPNSPEIVKNPNRLMPKFKKYYPSISDMNFMQKSFYKYWQERWKKGRPIKADLSYIFTYIYEILENAIQDKNSSIGYLSELNALKNCYPGKINAYLSEWITDLLEYNEDYVAAYNNMIANDDTWSSIAQINKLLNLKLLLGEPMDGKDLLYFGKKMGVNLFKRTIENINEAIEMANRQLIEFEEEKSMPFLKYIEEQYGYEKRFQELILCGIPIYKNEKIEHDGITLEFTGPSSYAVKYKSFRFNQMSFVVEFVTDKVIEINQGLKEKYTKSKKRISKRPYINLWYLKIMESFKNPAIVDNNSDCKHEYLQLKNHWETFRKYECINCHEIFMCSCDKEIIEQTIPYQIKGTWLDGICPKCRGLDDTSPITSGKLMYGNAFYAQHWREIAIERSKIAIEISKRDASNISENSFKLIQSKSQEAENRVRARYGIPPVGETWISETVLFKNLKIIFSDYEVIHHARPDWLGRQHLDVYIPEKGIAFEYQGVQHKKPIEFFGGKEGLQKRKELDVRKEYLCKKNDVTLIYIHDGEDYSVDNIKKRLKKYIDLI